MSFLEGLETADAVNRSETVTWVEYKIAQMQMSRFQSAFYLSQDVANLAPVEAWLWKEKSAEEKLLALRESRFSSLAEFLSDAELERVVQISDSVSAGDEISRSDMSFLTSGEDGGLLGRITSGLEARGEPATRDELFRLEKHDGTTPLTLDETIEALENHWSSVAPARAKIISEYNRGINILSAIIENGRKPIAERPRSITVGSRMVTGDDGKEKLEFEELSVEDMHKELTELMAKPRREVTALDVALKNAYAMYLGHRAPSWAHVRNEKVILQQVLASASEIPEYMTGLVNLVDEFVSDFIDEVKRRDEVDGTTFEFADPETRDSAGKPLPIFRIPRDILRRAVLDGELGGALRPFIGSPAAHDEWKDRAWAANVKGMGTSMDPTSGSLETQTFDRQTPLLVGPPGAGKNSILAAFAQRLFMRLRIQNTPQTSSSDKSIPILDSATQEMNSATNEAEMQSVIHPSVLLLNEIFQMNPDGTGIVKTIQDYLLSGIVNPMNDVIKTHPGTLVVGAGNDDTHGHAENFETPDDSIFSRFVVFRLSMKMILSRWPAWLEKTFGHLVKPGTPSGILLQFMKEKDNMGFLNYAKEYHPRNRDSLAEALDERIADTRSMTMLLELFTRNMGANNVSMKQALDWLSLIGGDTVTSSFKSFAKVFSAIRTRDELKEAVSGTRPWTTMLMLETAFSYDREKRKFTLSTLPVSAVCRLADAKKLLGPEFHSEIDRYFASSESKNVKGETYPSWADSVMKYAEKTSASLKKEFPEAEKTGKKTTLEKGKAVLSDLKNELSKAKSSLAKCSVAIEKSTDAKEKTSLEKERKGLEKTVAETQKKTARLGVLVSSLSVANDSIDEFKKFYEKPVTIKGGKLEGGIVDYLEGLVNNTWGLKQEIIESKNSGLGGVHADSLMVARLICTGELDELRANIESAIRDKKPVDGEHFRKAAAVIAACPHPNTRDSGLVAIRDLFDPRRHPAIADHLFEYGFTKVKGGGTDVVVNKDCCKGETMADAFKVSQALQKSYVLLRMAMNIPGFEGTLGNRIRNVVGLNEQTDKALRSETSVFGEDASGRG